MDLKIPSYIRKKKYWKTSYEFKVIALYIIGQINMSYRIYLVFQKLNYYGLKKKCKKNAYTMQG